MAGQAIHPAHSFRPRSSLPCLATTHHRAPPRVSPLWPLQREFGSRNSIPAAAITSGDIKGQPAPCLVSPLPGEFSMNNTQSQIFKNILALLSTTYRQCPNGPPSPRATLKREKILRDYQSNKPLLRPLEFPIHSRAPNTILYRRE